MVPDAHIVSVICSFALGFFFFILAACGHCHSFPLDILWTDYVLNIKKRDFDLCQQTRKRGKKRTDWRNILPRPAIKFTSFHPLSLILFHPCFPWKMCVEFGKTHGREGRGRWESDSEDHLFLPSSPTSLPFFCSITISSSSSSSLIFLPHTRPVGRPKVPRHSFPNVFLFTLGGTRCPHSSLTFPPVPLLSNGAKNGK